jgi:hypothetical protein
MSELSIISWLRLTLLTNARPWKPVSIGDNGEEKNEIHWGAMTANREPKFSLKCGSSL